MAGVGVTGRSVGCGMLLAAGECREVRRNVRRHCHVLARSGCGAAAFRPRAPRVLWICLRFQSPGCRETRPAAQACASEVFREYWTAPHAYCASVLFQAHFAIEIRAGVRGRVCRPGSATKRLARRYRCRVFLKATADVRASRSWTQCGPARCAPQDAALGRRKPLASVIRHESRGYASPSPGR